MTRSTACGNSNEKGRCVMTTAIQQSVRDRVSHVGPRRLTPEQEPKPYVGILFALLALLLVVALLALSAALAALQIPGTPIWHEFPTHWPIV